MSCMKGLSHVLSACSLTVRLALGRQDSSLPTRASYEVHSASIGATHGADSTSCLCRTRVPATLEVVAAKHFSLRSRTHTR
jgi:hypothetical protein